MENKNQMRKRHEKELSNLEKKCKHKKISKWKNHYWAPGHLLGQCRTCMFCGKVMEKTWQDVSEMKIIRKGNTFSVSNPIPAQGL